MTANRFGILNAFQLKLIMVILMLLDHLYFYLFRDQLLWAHYAARVVAPVFCYLLAEGMVYTRDRRRYLLRLLCFAAAMQVGNLALFTIYGQQVPNSILMTLFLAGAVIVCVDKLREAESIYKLLWSLAVLVLFIASLFFEGGTMIPMMVVIFYCLRSHPVVMWLAYFGFICLPFLIQGIQDGSGVPVQFYMFTAILPILLYNHQRGPSGAAAKYFFYVFYPLHIWILFIIKQQLL